MRKLSIFAFLVFLCMVVLVASFKEPVSYAQGLKKDTTSVGDINKSTQATKRDIIATKSALEALPEPKPPKPIYRKVQKKVYIKPSPETIYFFYQGATLEKKVHRDGGLLVIDLDSVIKWAKLSTESDTIDRVDIEEETETTQNTQEKKPNLLQRIFGKKNDSTK